MDKIKLMRAMLFEEASLPLRLCQVKIPEPQEGQILLQVEACAVCRTDLHIVAGELIPARLPLILGHQIVGRVVGQGPKAGRFSLGERVGVPWLGKTCGACPFCESERENLCDSALFTGFDLDGGFAEFCIADERYCHLLPESYSSSEAAPLLCGGLIGFRAFRMTGNAERIGFYGFGSAAHILLQIARYQGKEIYAFTRPGDDAAQALARDLGAVWAGSSEEVAPGVLDAALIFASAGELIPKALANVRKGGSVICAGIHMSDIPSFPYELLYGERILRSVAHLTREDGEEFFKIAKECAIHTHITTYALEEANRALSDLREGKITGSAVIEMKKGLR